MTRLFTFSGAGFVVYMDILHQLPEMYDMNLPGIGDSINLEFIIILK